MDFDRPLALVNFGTLCFVALPLVAATSCASTCDCRERLDSGAAAVGAAVVAPGLPTPPGAANVPRPGGVPGHLRILDWAGYKSAVSYTFDDGQPSQVEHYAELAATGVRLSFFLNSSVDAWERDFASTFSQAARDGHEIGNHTAHHCHADADGTLFTANANDPRAACPGESAAAELDDCSAYIASALGVPHVWTAALPFGDVGFEAAARQRFFLSRGATGGTVAPNDDTDPFNLPMWGPAENDGADRFNAAVDGAHTSGRWVIMLLHSIAPTTTRWYATVDISAIMSSIAHAKSLGDVWIDSMENVGAYWRAQKVLSSVPPTLWRNSQVWTWRLPDHFPTGKNLRVTVDGGTIYQRGRALPWDGHGYYEIELDAGSLSLSP
jgi:peptidoglycan/xylan/chitin deacetylase (PgdA/CDA1 family)